MKQRIVMKGPCSHRSCRLPAIEICGLALTLSACLEPQVAPDLPAISSPQFQIETLADGLEYPWAVEVSNDDQYFITGNRGQLWQIEDGVTTLHDGLVTALDDLARDKTMTQGQGGLLDVAIAPDFAMSGDLYISYSYGAWDSNGTALSRVSLNENAIADVTSVFKVPFAKEAGSHFGGRIAFLEDGSLILTTGDGFALREEAQKVTSHLGKIVRLNRDGSVPDNNPAFGDGAVPGLYSIGHRNIQGLAYDAVTGNLWANEHGPRGGDELNLIRPGQNYGWPIVTKGLDYQGAKISPAESLPDYVDPVHGWTPSIAPSGLAIYRGDLFPQYKGLALIGGLASGDVRMVNTDTGEEIRLLDDLKTETDKFRVRDVKVDNDGAILILVEDPDNGRLLRLTPK